MTSILKDRKTIISPTKSPFKWKSTVVLENIKMLKQELVRRKKIDDLTEENKVAVEQLKALKEELERSKEEKVKIEQKQQ